MTTLNSNRSWISTLVAVSFTAVAITGTLMLFHVRSGAINNVHEWMGLLLAAAGIVHTVINWRVFVGHLRQRPAIISLVVGLVLCIALFVVREDEGREHHRGGPHSPQAEEVSDQATS